jgi:hypothetical protein
MFSPFVSIVSIVVKVFCFGLRVLVNHLLRGEAWLA